MDAAGLSRWILAAPLLAGLGYCAWRTRGAPGLRVGAAVALLLSLGLLQLLSEPAVAPDWSELLLSDQLPALSARFAVHLLAALTALALVRSVRERDRAEEVQWESMEAVRELGAFFSLERGRFEVRLQQLLALGCRKLDLELGMVCRIEGERSEIVQIHAPPDFPIERGESIALAQTLCRDAVRTSTPLAVESVAQRGRREPMQELLGVQSYLGIALRVDGDVFGTLSFASIRTRGRRFAGVEKQLLELMAHWVETELSRLQHERSKRLLAPRSEEVDRRRVDLDDTLRQLEPAMRDAVGGCELLLELGGLDRDARVYRYELDRVLWSLLHHAVTSSDDVATLRVSTSAVTPPEDAPGSSGTFLSLALRASGSEAAPAVDPERAAATAASEPAPDLAALPAQPGALSLSRIRRLLEDAGGDLSIQSERGLTTFTAWLPAAPALEPAGGPQTATTIGA